MRGRFGQFSIRIERKVKRKMLNDCRKVFHSFSNLVQHVLANFSGYAMENLNFSCAPQNDSIFAYNLPVTIDTDGNTHTHTQWRQKFFAKVIASSRSFSFPSPPLWFLSPLFPFVVLFFSHFNLASCLDFRN